MAAKRAAKRVPKKAAAKVPAKAAPKKVLKKPVKASGDGTKASRKRAPKAALADLSKKERISFVMDKINNAHGRKVIKLANDDNCSYLLRRPFGIIGLDLLLAGGLPASASSVLMGPDGVGKDYLFWRMLGEQQRIHGEDFACAVYMTEFKQDKFFMKDFCGFHVGFTEEEIEELDIARQRAGLPGLTSIEIDYYRKQIGNPVIFDGVSADDGFDILLDFAATNTCQVIGVNSIGNLDTEAKREKESLKEHAQRASEASLFSRLMPRLANILNGGGPNGERNETTPVFINQARAKTDARQVSGRPLSEKEKYQGATQSWSLKHLKAVELTLHKGPKLYDDDKRQTGRIIQWETSKGKLGLHEGLKGTLDFYYDGGIDIYKDLVETATGLGVIEKSGAWLEYSQGGLHARAQGINNFRDVLAEGPDLVESIRESCFRVSGVMYRYS